MNGKAYAATVLESVGRRDAEQKEFLQAAREVLESLAPCLDRHPEFEKAKILERLIEPDRVIMFRVPWQDDRGDFCVNRGFRVQFNNAIGPYKGGLRFHPSVNLGILKFLGFEQIFKNSLTTLPMGGAKGGSDFDPKGKSDHEVMRFCKSFMAELHKYVGANIDVPAGDIGVGGREIGFLFGQWKRLTNSFEGMLTGKGVLWGGSLVRPEATGFGCVYFVEEMLGTRSDSIRGKKVVISGSGNVAQYAAQKVAELGGIVIAMSDSEGTVFDKSGIAGEKWQFIMDLKNVRRGRMREYAEKFRCEFQEGKRPWAIPCDVALPCATQNEIDAPDAKQLVSNKCMAVGEGANMPTTLEGTEIFIKAGVLFAPGKASNAGGVATSGLEMSQNSMRLSWTREEVDKRLGEIMKSIHKNCAETAQNYGAPGNYVLGGNIAGFMKVARAMVEQGLV